MIKNYFKTAWRNLWKNKFFSAINILGLSIGLACCILMFLFIQHELSYDKFNVNAKNIYDKLSLADLRKILLGERRFWQGNVQVSLVLREQGTRERDHVLAVLLKMTNADFERHWQAKMFRGESSALPLTVPSNGENVGLRKLGLRRSAASPDFAGQHAADYEAWRAGNAALLAKAEGFASYRRLLADGREQYRKQPPGNPEQFARYCALQFAPTLRRNTGK